ncbi:MAG: phosphonate metabolism transcriptional regulator PhnF, partial [Acidiphilium sp. 37-67-22]
MTIERKPGEALWSQIAEALAGEIAAGAYRDDPRLPTETLLAARFGVNRHTIRRALVELANAGLIRTEHGRGSFAADAVLDYRIGQRPRFSEWVRGHHRTPLGRVLRLEEIPLAALEGEAAAVAAALEIEAGGRVIVLERVGTADALAVSLSRHVFPADRVAGLLAALRAHGSVTA